MRSVCPRSHDARPRRPGRRRPRRARPPRSTGAARPSDGSSSVFSNARCRSGVGGSAADRRRRRRLGRARRCTRTGVDRVRRSRSSSGCGVLATSDDHVELGAQLDRRRRADASPSRRSAPSSSTRTALNRLTLGRDVAPVEAVLGQRRARAGRGPFGCAPLHAAVAVPVVVGAPVRAPHRQSWRPLVSATIVISTRPMSESSSDAGAEVRLPLHLHRVGHVEPLGGLRGVVDEQLHAGVAVDVGEPQHGAAGQTPRRVAAGADRLVPDDRRPGRRRRAGRRRRSPAPSAAVAAAGAGQRRRVRGAGAPAWHRVSVRRSSCVGPCRGGSRIASTFRCSHRNTVDPG